MRRMARERGGALRRTPAMASASGVRNEENVPPGGALDTAPSTPAPTAPAVTSRPPLRAIQPQGQPRPLAATPKKGFGVKKAAGKGKKPTTGESSAEVPRPKVRDAILFWEENCNRNAQNVSSTWLQDECSELKRTQALLEKALNLNAIYQQELASLSSVEQDKDETHRQVEDELAKVITSLTEEVSSLRQQLDVSNKKEEYYVSLLKRKEEGICQMESQLDQSKRVYETRLEETGDRCRKWMLLLHHIDD